ncbi:Adenine DNA glycosylase [Balamuthia mandrillaris]
MKSRAKKKKSAEEEEEDEDYCDFQITKQRKASSRSRPSKSKVKSAEAADKTECIKDIEDLSAPIIITDQNAKSFCFQQDEVERLRSDLLSWYDEHKREMPWRTISEAHRVRRTATDVPPQEEEADEEEANNVGYAVWVSEVMLQQTRVDTVVAYFNKWMKRWPTVAHLARATLEEVNEAWAGLGYYRRARYLHQGATLLMEKFKGRLPRTAAELKKIPGIGPYTAGAIASIAFGESTPLVDGNVIRVLSRLRAIPADPTHAQTVKLFWKLAGDLVCDNRPGCFNQALMELGATVCTVQSPKCSQLCPISSHCRAFQQASEGNEGVTRYPLKVKKTKQREETVHVCIVTRQSSSCSLSSIIKERTSTTLKREDEEDEEEHRVSPCFSLETSYLIVQRPDTGLLASLWEFPTVIVDEEEAESKSKRTRKMDAFLVDALGISSDDIKNGERQFVGETTHLFSHIRQRLLVEQLCLPATTTASKRDVQAAEEEEVKCKEEENDEDEAVRKEQRKRKRAKLKGDSGAVELQKTTKRARRNASASTTSIRAMRWLTAEELSEAAISKGMKKCFELTTKPKVKPGKKTKTTKPQATLDKFFSIGARQSDKR